ncbi:uncharacterized protein LOC129301243 [Prosopis cineraria]|uniref:uncharacterized protein LOC129300555 n=1 Tax=Prosopis cineraria TaxID=364024 RepID=UPI002410038C|nr:uncharacterized protein LOC129300555 [Prosopis cineraria]XP_054795791.1 uncharacterized protein LOC129301243 [Prosopis cineraria]
MDVPTVQYEAVITVPPLKMTVPRRVRRVLVSDPKTAAEEFRGCYQVVMYYENLDEEGFGWVLAGWIVESLGIALSEHPMIAGRLQRKAEGGGGDPEMEILSNDCGIRMVEARISIALSDFLESSEKHNIEHELVFWKDIDEQSPEFSPLFYIQMTSFKCGGYSIGISCSLLLADFLVVDNFLKKWADIHKNEAVRNGKTRMPLFYHPRLKNAEAPPPNIIRRTPYKNGGPSLLFKITSEDSEFEMESARLCVQEAEKKLHRKMGSEFSLFVKEPSEVIKVEACEYSRQALGFKHQVSCATWDEFGVYDIAFHEGKRPVHVSRWIGSASEGNVLAVKYPKEGVSAVMVVTLAAENGTLN